jgi:hypothetical protein
MFVDVRAKNGTYRKRQLDLFAAHRNGKLKSVFLGRQRINGNQRLLVQQTRPSMLLFQYFRQRLLLLDVSHHRSGAMKIRRWMEFEEITASP